MAGSIPDPDWTHVGSTSNAEFYRVTDTILAIVPHEDSRDNAETARESIAFQDEYWRRAGHRGAVIVHMDPVLDQDAGARDVYAGETSDTLTTCYALVGESFFARATAAVFTGLAQPGPPTNVFRSIADARSWIDEINRKRGGSV